MRKNIFIAVLFLALGIVCTAFVVNNNSVDRKYTDSWHVTDGARYIHQPVNMMRDYQLKISEDEKSIIVYQFERKVGVIPFKPVTVKMSIRKDDISWLLMRDDLYIRQQEQ
jgi:hypothetical protein